MNRLWLPSKTSCPGRISLILSALLMLSGCAATPKQAPSQFESFQKVTASITQDIPKIDLLSLPQVQYTETIEILRAIDEDNQRLVVINDNYGLSNLNPVMSKYAENFQARVSFLQYLAMYSNSLKSIMASTSIAELNTNIKTFGKTMDTAKTNALATIFPQLSSISFTQIADIASAITSYTFEKVRNAKVKYIINQASPTIRETLKHLAAHIGSCSPSNNSTGFIATAVTNYYNTSLTQDQKKFSAIDNKDKKKAEERFNALQAMAQKKHKFELTCVMLDNTNNLLINYTKLHDSLAEAFDNDSSDLTASLTNINFQIQTIEAAITALTAKEK